MEKHAPTPSKAPPLRFYPNYLALCAKKRVAPSAFAVELGLTGQAVDNWKNKGTIPKYEILRKISKCFGIAIEDLVEADLDATPTPPLAATDADLTEKDAEIVRLRALVDSQQATIHIQEETIHNLSVSNRELSFKKPEPTAATRDRAADYILKN
jgi:transcriptional regulator with XRE-family HTH domain